MKKSILDGKVFNFFLSVCIVLLIVGGLLLVYRVSHFVPATIAQAEAQDRLISLGKAQVHMGLLLLVVRRLRNYLRSPD